MRLREGILKQRIEVIYNGVDYLQQPDMHTRNEMPENKKIPILVYAGRLSPEKGLGILLQALAIVDQAGLRFQCLLVGEGPARQEIEVEIGRLELQEKILLVGRQAEVQPWLERGDIFVLPSNWEGASLALLEAMAVGLPVVATSSGGTPELVEDGVTGILVPPSDSTALAAAITRMLGSPDLRARMGASGSKRVDENFRIEKTVSQISALYTGLFR